MQVASRERCVRFQDPSVNFFARDVMRATQFYTDHAIAQAGGKHRVVGVSSGLQPACLLVRRSFGAATTR